MNNKPTMIKESQQQRARSDLASTASYITYESLPLDLFLLKVQTSLKEVLSACTCSLLSSSLSSLSPNQEKTKTMMTRYDAVALVDCLLQGIEWDQLCRDYDQRKDTTASPLHQILCLFESHSVWPLACALPLAQTLASTIVLDGDGNEGIMNDDNALTSRSQWSPSRKLLMDHLQTWSTRVPALRASMIPDVLVSISRQAKTLGQIRRLLSLVKYYYWTSHSSSSRLSSSHRESLPIVVVLIEMLSVLDQMEVNHHHHHQQQQQSTPALDDAGMITTYQRRRRRSRIYDSNLHCFLHGELSDEEEENLVAKTRRYSHRSKCTNENAHQYQPTTTSVSISCQLDQLRNKCIQTLLLLLREGSSNNYNSFIETLVNGIQAHPRSPSIRLSTVLWLSQQQQKQQLDQPLLLLESLLNHLWSRILVRFDTKDDHVDAPSGLLHLYSELLAECAWFDRQDVLSSALQPLFRVLATQMTSSQHLNDEGNQKQSQPQEKQQKAEVFRPFRCCLAFLLSRRGVDAVTQSLLSPSSSPRSNLWTHLTLLYDEWSDWYHEAWHQHSVEIRLALQAAGILSVAVIDVCKENSSNKKTTSSLSSSPRNHENSHNDPSKEVDFGMRAVASRCYDLGPQQRQLFSHCPNNNYRSSFDHHGLSSKQPCLPIRSSVAEENHLSEDLLQHVFSFLGYKRLMRMGLVCREWRGIANRNQLWQQAYQSRYSCLLFPKNNDPIKASSNNKELPSSLPPWRSLFMGRWTAERAILHFRRQHHHARKSGWKVRLCRYVGCLQVLSTHRQALQHEESHTNKRKQRSNTTTISRKGANKRSKEV